MMTYCVLLIKPLQSRGSNIEQLRRQMKMWHDLWTRARAWPQTLCQRAYIILLLNYYIRRRARQRKNQSSAARAVHAAPDIFMSEMHAGEKPTTKSTVFYKCVHLHKGHFDRAYAHAYDCDLRRINRGCYTALGKTNFIYRFNRFNNVRNYVEHTSKSIHIM
jgi:hypothetical protein